MIETKKEIEFTYNICRVVGHEIVDGRFCGRCGLHKFVDELGTTISNQFIGHPCSKELPYYIHAYARLLLDKLVDKGDLFSYSDLSISEDARDYHLYLEFFAKQYPSYESARYAIRLSISI